MHLGSVPEVRREPRVVADPGRCKGIVDEEARLAGFDVMVKGEHTLPLEYTAKR